MGLNTSAYQEYAPGKVGSPDKYGDADYNRDKAAGMSDSAILAQINAQPGKMGDGGVGGNLYNRIAAGANSGGSSGGGGGGYSGGSVGAGAGAYNPGSVNFNPGGINMGGDMADAWSNEDFVRGLAKERAEAYTEGSTTNQNQSVVNNIEQNIGNKGDWETNIGDNNTINNSSIGNDYSLNMGSINVANRLNQVA